MARRKRINRNIKKTRRRYRRVSSRGRRNMRGKNVRARGMTHSTWQKHIENSPWVFTPDAALPGFPLAHIQYLYVSGAFESAGLDPERIFPDGFLYDHLKRTFELYRFYENGERISIDEVRMRQGVITSLIFALRSMFGYDAGLRHWVALWDASNSDVEIVYDQVNTAFEQKLVDPDDNDYLGWDQDFELWGRLAEEKLRRSVNQEEATKFMMMADVGNIEYMRQSVAKMVEMQYPKTHRERVIMGEPALSGSIAEETYKNYPGLVRGAQKGDVKVNGQEAHGGSWAKDIAKAMTHPYAQDPSFPVEGYDHRLDTLKEWQTFNTMEIDRAQPHSGIDIAAPEGSVVRSIYEGKVVEIIDDWYDSDRTDPRGNTVVVLHEFEVGGYNYDFLAFYNHLAAVGSHVMDGKNRKVTELEEGQVVRKGQTIGFVGDSGASKGAHLHFTAKFAQDLHENGSGKKETLDPTPILRYGLIPALIRKGVQFSDAPRPSLATGGLLLTDIARQTLPANSGAFGGVQALFGQAKEMAENIVEKVLPAAHKVDDTLTEAGGKVLDKMFEASGEDTVVRKLLMAGYAGLFPGMGADELAAQALDGLERGHRENMKGSDVRTILEAVFSDVEVPDETKSLAVNLAMSQYTDSTTKNGQE